MTREGTAQPSGTAAPRLLIVSNRLPVTIESEGQDLRLSESSGGLVTALRGPHREGGGPWIGWPGETGGDEAARLAMTARLAELAAVPVFLDAADVAGYYDGFANGVLWPLFHYLLDKVPLDAHAEWEAYRKVNEHFADVVASHHREGDRVWIHDYQLALVPALLRQRVPGARIGYFLHIPFPSPDVFRILPWREEVLRGMLGADLVSFHTAGYRHNFAYAAAQELGLDLDSDVLALPDRRVTLGVHPIGVDAAQLAAVAASPEVAARVEALRRDAGGRVMVLGVDRLDYTKGIPRRLLAIDKLLTAVPALRERLLVVQIAVPTRERVDAYADLRRLVNELVGRINARHGSAAAMPIHLLYRSLPIDELVALYRAADVMLVTPLRDGMNLVAKEFVAVRDDEDGVLILSEFAGASAELSGALQVNPYDLEGVGRAVRQAIDMPREERRARMSAMRGPVIEHDAQAWAAGFLRDLDQLRPMVAGGRTAAVAAAPVTLEQAMEALATAPARALLLDYDGTLVGLTALPDLARPDAELLALLGQLAALPATDVHVVSGRTRAWLESWLGRLPIGLHAEHGLWSRPAGTAQGWRPMLDQVPEEALHALAVRIQELGRRTPGAFVELKSAGIAFHYRKVEPALAAVRLRELRALAAEAIPEGWRLAAGVRVVEVRPKAVDKGTIAARVAAAAGPAARMLAAGDDQTDDDMFTALPAGSVKIQVGDAGLSSSYRLAGTLELRAVLARLVERMRGR